MELSVLCFHELTLKKEVVVLDIYEWKFNEPHDYVVVRFTDLVTSCVDQLTDVNLKQKLTTGFLQQGLLASFILDTTETLIAHQNWNSAGANVGTAICNMALLIAECQRCGDFRNYVSNCPYAIKLTGGSYGSYDNVYVEYMAKSLCDTEYGGFHLYLDHNTFQKENHGKVIVTPYPAPKPTISTRGDWCVRYYGLHVLAEAKSCHGSSKDTDEGINFGIFVASNQLAFSPSALLMHSANSQFRFNHMQ